MDIIHRLGRATAAEVRAAMAQPPTDPAVRTTLRILVAKGRLNQEYDGPRYVYFPTVAPETVRRLRFPAPARHFLRRLGQGGHGRIGRHGSGGPFG